MKVHFALILASALLPAACGQITAEDVAAAKNALASMTSDEQAANDLYLDDTTDSAADESGSGESSEEDAAKETKDDIKAKRLEQMAEMLIKRLDADASGSLSLEEFLVGPEKRAEETEIDAEKAAKMKEKLTEDFNKFAGEDKLLSAAEIQELLKSAAPRVGRHRCENFPGKQEERVQQSASELIKEYDKDGDGKLDAAELEALQAAKKSEMDEFRKGRGKGGRGPEGQGPGKGRGPVGQDEGSGNSDSENGGSEG